MAERVFQVRARAPEAHLVGMARAMHHASQTAAIMRNGVGNYVTWEKLPDLLPGHQEQWIAAAEAGLAHIFSSPSLPVGAHIPGGICG
jgi:hypothetical protein